MEFEWQDLQLGETSGPHVIDGIEQIGQASLLLAQQTSRVLLIRANTLRQQIYERPAFVEAVKQLAIRNSRTKIRILVSDIEPIKKNGHRLVELTQRLSSSIEIRVGAKDWAGDTRSFMLADECGYVLRPRWFDLHGCTVDFNNRYEAKKLGEFFQEVWDQSQADSNLRQLSL